MKLVRPLVFLAVAALAASSAAVVDDGFDAHVDSILGEMAAEDDAYGIDELGNAPNAEEMKHSASLTELKTFEDIETFINKVDDTPVVLGYFDIATAMDEFEIFDTLGERDGEDYRYGFTTNRTILEEKEYETSAVVVYLAPKYMNPRDDKRKARYPNSVISNIVSLKTFVRQKAVPLVGEMTLNNEKLYRNTRLPVVTVFMNIDHERNQKEYSYVANRVRKIALEWRGKVNFNIANIKEYRRDMDHKYDIEEAYSNKAIMVGLRDGSMYYPMEGDFSGSKLKVFVEDFFDGALDGNEQFDGYLNKDADDPTDDVVSFADAAAAANKATAAAASAAAGGADAAPAAEGAPAAPVSVEGASTAEAASSTQTPSAESASKTSADKKPTKDASKTKPKPKSKPKAKDKAPRPPKTPDSEVINISQLNIKEIFSTKKADVFMVFHAPSCGLCKRLKPEFRKVSNAFKDDGGMIVAAFDVTAHPVPPGFDVENLPVIYYIPANNKKRPELYTGPKETGDMIQYLFKHRTTPVGPGSDLFNALQKDTEEDKLRKRREFEEKAAAEFDAEADSL